MNLSHRTNTLTNGKTIHVWFGNVANGNGSVTIDWTEGSHAYFWQWVSKGGSVMGSAASYDEAVTAATKAIDAASND